MAAFFNEENQDRALSTGRSRARMRCAEVSERTERRQSSLMPYLGGVTAAVICDSAAVAAVWQLAGRARHVVAPQFPARRTPFAPLAAPTPGSPPAPSRPSKALEALEEPSSRT